MKKQKLIIHVGTPKTGSTSLQFAFFNSRANLAKEGIFYPKIDIFHSPPKHQWIVNKLFRKDINGFLKNFEKIFFLSQKNQFNVTILSTEGIYNHWYDFSDEAIKMLSAIKDLFDVKIWCFFRDTVSFALSVYSQLLKNSPSNAVPLYGTSMHLEDIIDHPWFQLRLNYLKFIHSIESVFKPRSLIASRFESKDVLDTARSLLGINKNTLADIPYKNKSMSLIGIDLLRRLNSLTLIDDTRKTLVKKIIDIDNTLKETSQRVYASETLKKKILAISYDSETYLKRQFGISWNF